MKMNNSFAESGHCPSDTFVCNSQGKGLFTSCPCGRQRFLSTDVDTDTSCKAGMEFNESVRNWARSLTSGAPGTCKHLTALTQNPK